MICLPPCHEIARIIHSMIRSGTPYAEKTAFNINPITQPKKAKILKKIALKNGHQLIPPFDTETIESRGLSLYIYRPEKDNKPKSI